jgi:hypothetical protein
MPQVSSSSLQELRQQLDSSLKAPPPVAAPQVSPHADFCSLWPTAKPILQAIAGVIGFIPGVGALSRPRFDCLDYCGRPSVWSHLQNVV